MANEKRLIDANVLIRHFRGACVAKYPSTFLMGLFAAADETAKQPTVDAVEVVHGWWMGFNTFMTCSVCDTDFYYTDNDVELFNYCPNCGADMRERKAGDDN